MYPLRSCFGTVSYPPHPRPQELRNDLGDNFKVSGDAPTTDQYDHEFPLLWDAHKSRACVCDPKWTDVDCSRR